MIKLTVPTLLLYNETPQFPPADVTPICSLNFGPDCSRKATLQVTHPCKISTTGLITENMLLSSLLQNSTLSACFEMYPIIHTLQHGTRNMIGTRQKRHVFVAKLIHILTLLLVYETED